MAQKKLMLAKDPDAVVRPVPGYEGLYAVAQDGRVWSYPKSTGVSRHCGQWLAPWVTNGYLVVGLKHADGTKKKQYVHRIVAIAWVANPDASAFPYINHKDGNRGNPLASNLEWCNRSMNIQHAWDTGARVVSQKVIEHIRAWGKKSPGRRDLIAKSKQLPSPTQL